MTKKKEPKNKKPVGRPRTEMTDENIAKILRTVALGIWPDRAAQMHGISPEAMRVHKHRHPEFVTALEKAEADAESSIHGKILRHMDKQWTACAWMLERRWPSRWKKEPDVQVNVEQKVEVDASGPPEPDPGHLVEYASKLASIIGNLKEGQSDKITVSAGVASGNGRMNGDSRTN